MTHHLVCIEDEKLPMAPFHMTFIGETWPNMYEIGSGVVLTVSVKSTNRRKHGPMQVRLYEGPFCTIGVDYVGQLPTTPTGNKWILTAVCPYSNFLRTIPVQDKQALTTAAQALFDNVFLQYGYPTVLQSDQGGEWLNAVLRQLTKLLSIEHIVTTSYRPHLNGSTERVHRWLNAPIGVYLGVKTCEVFLCFVTIMFVLSFVLTSLFSLFYVTREGDRFLHRG